MNPNQRLLVATVAYAVTAGLIAITSFNSPESAPQCPAPKLSQVLLGFLAGASAGALLYSLSFATAGVVGLMLSRELSTHLASMGWPGLLTCYGLIAPMTFGFSDFLSVYMARTKGFAKSPRSFAKYLCCAAIMGASVGAGASTGCVDIRQAVRVPHPIVIGSLSLAGPLLVYLRTERVKNRIGSIALASAAMTLSLAVLLRLDAEEMGFVALAVPWLIPEKTFTLPPAELPRPHPVILRVRSSDLREELAKLREALEGFYVEEGS